MITIKLTVEEAIAAQSALDLILWVHTGGMPSALQADILKNLKTESLDSVEKKLRSVLEGVRLEREVKSGIVGVLEGDR